MLLWKLFVLCTAFWAHEAVCGQLVNRDDSGMVTIQDVVTLNSNTCSAMRRINKMLSNRLFKVTGVTKLIHSLVLPVPNPIPIVDPLGVLRLISSILFRTNSFLNRLNEEPNLTKEQAAEAVKQFETLLNQTDERNTKVDCTAIGLPKNCSDLFKSGNSKDEDTAELLLSLANLSQVQSRRASLINPGGVFLTLGDVIKMTGYFCDQVDRWKDTFGAQRGFLGFLKVQNSWIPIRDFRYPLNPIKLMDPWEVRKIPGKVISGAAQIPERIWNRITGMYYDVFGG